jgi:hypothetical protein
VKSDKLEIGRILHLKLEIRNLKLDDPSVQSEISDFEFEMQDSSDFEFVRFHDSPISFPHFSNFITTSDNRLTRPVPHCIIIRLGA